MRNITKNLILCTCIVFSATANASELNSRMNISESATKLATSIDDVTIKVTNGGDSRISNLGFTRVEMKCSGPSSDPYTITRVSNSSITVRGPFVGDKRNICKLPDDDVYFILHNLIISFNYNGIRHECVLAADVGTSYDHFHGNSDKLQSYIHGNPYGSKEAKETPAICIGNPQFMYKINQGTSSNWPSAYDAGSIEIRHVDSQRVSNQPITWTFFVNGIMNSIDDAMLSSLRMAKIAPYSHEKNLQYGLLYNRSHGILMDSLDLATMKSFDSYIATGQYIYVYEKAHKISNCQLSEECKHRALEWYLAMVYTEPGFDGKTPSQILGHDFSSVWGSFISYGVYPTDKLLLVAHSQGNLYANVLTDFLRYQHNFPANNMNTIHVGVTSARTKLNVDNNHDVYKLFPAVKLPEYITNVEDHIINAWRDGYTLSPLATPVKGNFSYQSEPRLSEYSYDLMNHGFIEAYLNHRSTYAGISNMLYKMIAANEYALRHDNASTNGVTFFKIQDAPKLENGFPEKLNVNTPLLADYDINIYPPKGGNSGGAVGTTIFTNYGCVYCSAVVGLRPTTIEHGFYQIKTIPSTRYIILATQRYDTEDCGYDTFELEVNGTTSYKMTCGTSKKVITKSLDGSGIMSFSFYYKDDKAQPRDMHLFYAFNHLDYKEIHEFMEYDTPIMVKATNYYPVYKMFPLFESQWIQRLSEDGRHRDGGVFDIRTDWFLNVINSQHGDICNYYEYSALLVCPFTILHENYSGFRVEQEEFELSAIIPYGKYNPRAPLALTADQLSLDVRTGKTRDEFYRQRFSTYSNRTTDSKRLYVGFIESDTLDD